MIFIKKTKQIKALIAGAFVVVSGVCYSLFLPKESPDIEIVRGETEMVAERVTSTPVATPTPTAVPDGKTGGSGAESVTESLKQGKININTADAAQLMSLPGIGATRAGAIIDYRTIYGPFKKIEDIMQVKGIKEGIFSKIRDRICTDGGL